MKEASDWIRSALEQEGVGISGAIERVQAWSTVWRIPTDGGAYYFKACAPLLSHEAAVTEALYRWRPDCTLRVIKIDAHRGWLLMADGGPTLRQIFNRMANGADTKPIPTEVWGDILGLYASLQIDLAGHVDKLLQLGSPDRQLALLPDLYHNLLAEPEWLLIDQTDGLSVPEYERLLEAEPQVTDLCRQLGAYAIPMSLHHNDLHDANIFVDDGRPLFFDWGDSSIAHPFFSLRTVFVSIEYTFDLDELDPIFEELAQFYLQPWHTMETAENTTAAFKLAQRLWALSSAVKYKTQIRHVPALREEYGSAVPGLLQEFLAANPEF